MYESNKIMIFKEEFNDEQTLFNMIKFINFNDISSK